MIYDAQNDGRLIGLLDCASYAVRDVVPVGNCGGDLGYHLVDETDLIGSIAVSFFLKRPPVFNALSEALIEI